MGYTREQRLANEEKKKLEASDSTAENGIEKESVKNRTVKLTDDVLVTVKSNTFGKLIYINKKTGDKVMWSNYGDVQDMTIGDLRAMKGTQRAFYENQWILVECIAEEGYEYVTVEDIYKTLQVTQYYKDVLYPENLTEVLTWSVDEIKAKVPKMSKGIQTSLVIISNEGVENGTLDSISRIKAIEEVLNCSLNKPE